MRKNWSPAAFSLLLICAPFARAELPLAAHLQKSTWELLKAQLNGPLPFRNLSVRERLYQEAAQKQSFFDALRIYDPANRPRVEVFYSSFSPEDGRVSGRDLGHGLRVVKRLVEGEKVIEVKEFWPFDRAKGGLFRPDEIRIKTRVERGPRRVAGSERSYLYDRIRLAWGPAAREVVVHRRTLYDEHDGVRQVRVPVSAPYSCMNCHQAHSGLRGAFLANGETRNFESIVQESNYSMERHRMPGYVDYIDHLKKTFGDTKFVASVERSLRNGSRIWPSGLRAALRDAWRFDSASWLSEDVAVVDGQDQPSLLYRQGYYLGKYQERIYLDAIEQVFDGKYRWWDPAPAIP